MRYDEFRERWLAALRSARLLAHHDRPEETISLSTTERRWRVHLLPRPVEPFHAGATISFRWSPFESARSYTREEDLLTELLGRSRSGRATQLRLLRVDITLRASLPYGSTAPVPAPDVWLPWVASVEEKVDDALTVRRRKRSDIAWRGGLELEGRTSPNGAFAFHGMSVSAFEMIVVPRIWDDPKRREREASAGAQIDGLAKRFRGALDAWTANIDELLRWLRYAPGPPRTPSRPPRSKRLLGNGGAGPETTH
jgi:hypothetical protein